MDPRRLKLLVELSKRGSMRAVADATGLATSAVSQQLAVLAQETHTALIEPVGRNVRLTPAGHRLVEHAIGILGAIEAARADLGSSAAPSGVVRVAAFATAARDVLVPIVRRLQQEHLRVRLRIEEQEPSEVYELLADDRIDLGLVHDFDLGPHRPDPGAVERALWETPWSLGVPADLPLDGDDAVGVFRGLKDQEWIVNSRGTADEEVIRTIGAMAGFAPVVGHRADSLELVQDLIAAGLGVGLLPAARPTIPEVRLVPLLRPGVNLRAFAITRPGRDQWPALAVVLDMLEQMPLR
ncbi:LysR family transcriptional regulator [Nakamurella silvestris]|nr:LysR family transcriptional regulator [Nakamurella silvestris]